jgi:4-aminobutyrate aminotransferase-like enzyme
VMGRTSRQEATRIINDLRRRGVLVGATGRQGDVLKIRPPLTFGRPDADVLLDALDRALHTSV